MEVKAIQKNLITSPQKLREVVALVKNLKPTEAVEKLPFAKKRAAQLLRKVIMTAIANAKNRNLSEADLVFKEIQINEGPRLKRYRPAARGSAKPYQKKMSHIRVVLTTRESEISNPKSEMVRQAHHPELSRRTNSNVQNKNSKTLKK